jgi:hypothetical protein
MRLGTGICKVALGFPGTGAGGWDPSAFAPLAMRRHQGGSRASSARGTPVAFATPAPASRWGRDTGEGEKVGMRLTAGPTWQ